MKKIKYLALAIFSLALVNCSNDDNGQVKYNGTSFINFLNQGAEQQVAVVSNTTSTDVVLKVGTLLPVSGSHTVKIIPIEVEGGARLGVDYDIINDTDVLQEGETEGNYALKFYRTPAIEAGKKVSFRMETDLPQASFNTLHTINVRLTCPIEALVGNFNSTTYWNGADKQYIIEQPVVLDGNGVPQVSTQIIIKNFFPENAANTNFILSFNRVTFEILAISQGNTGRVSSVNGRAITATLTPGRPSKFNPCTREVTLNITYRAGVGATADVVNAVEVFTGIAPVE